MKEIILVVFSFFLLTTSLFGQQKEKYIRFTIDTREELLDITRIVSIDNVVNDTVYAYVNTKQLKEFKEQKDYTFHILEPRRTKSENLVMAEQVSDMKNWDQYPSYDTYVQMMNDFASNYPDLCKVESIGTTVEGRKLFVAKISDNVNQEEDEPEFFYTSTMHGDETTGYILMLRFIDSLLTTYSTNAEVKNLVDNIEIFINPNANPDGTYAGGDGTVSGAHRGNANYIDLNRNFPDPIDGDHPDGNDWQPETQAMMGFAEKHNIVMSANFHGGAEVANYPWDGTDRAHPDETWLGHISHVYANSAMDNSPSGYFTNVSDDGVTNGYDWYAVYGSRQDYMTYFQNGREVTMEISNIKLLPASSLPDYWNYNKEALFLYMQECLYGIRGIVTNELGDPIKAKIEVINHDTQIDQSFVYTDPDVGDYHRLIEPGTYNLAFHAESHYSDTVQNITVTQGNSVRVDVSLERKTILSVDKSEIIRDLMIDTSENILIKLTREGPSTLNYNIAVDSAEYKPWINVHPLDGSVSDETDSIWVELNTEGLETGIYKTTINILADNESSLEIPVEMIVNSSQVFTIQPDTLSYSFNRFEEITDSFTISNLNYDPVNYYLAFQDPEYENNIIISDTSGSIEARGNHKVSLNIHAEGLIPGLYNTKIVLTDNGGFIKKIPLILNILYYPVLKSNKDSIFFDLDGNKKDSTYFWLKNQSNTTIDFSFVDEFSNIPWLDVKTENNSIQLEDSIQVKILCTTEVMDTGVYNYDIKILQSYDDSVLTLPVKLKVTGDQVSGLEEVPGLKIVECYPNPFRQAVYLSLDLENSMDYIDVYAYNNAGQLLDHFYFRNLKQGKNQLLLDFDRDNLKKNTIIYLRIQTKSGQLTKKLIHLN